MFVEVTVKVLEEAEALAAFVTVTSAHCKACTCLRVWNHYIDSEGEAVCSDLH